ncbi:MAG: hypothetical protein F6K47_34995 [Symploca sp. SIO2E6]|nr:hypothetical protein [Symploca sp. SIO2E6]
MTISFESHTTMGTSDRITTDGLITAGTIGHGLPPFSSKASFNLSYIREQGIGNWELGTGYFHAWW